MLFFMVPSPDCNHTSTPVLFSKTEFSIFVFTGGVVESIEVYTMVGMSPEVISCPLLCEREGAGQMY